MNIAADLIEREIEEIEQSLVRFERRPHRTRALEVCTAVDRHCRMTEELLEPLLRKTVDDAHPGPDDHDALRDGVDAIRHASKRSELIRLVRELASSFEAHVSEVHGTALPALEDELGVARMNELGMSLLHWQHEDARRDRQVEDEFEELLELTRAELYEKAQEVDLDGRSTMKKVELAEALADL